MLDNNEGFKRVSKLVNHLSYNFSKCRANTDSKICLSTCTSRVLTGAIVILYDVNRADQEHCVSEGVRGPDFFSYQRIIQGNTGSIKPRSHRAWDRGATSQQLILIASSATIATVFPFLAWSPTGRRPVSD